MVTTRCARPKTARTVRLLRDQRDADRGPDRLRDLPEPEAVARRDGSQDANAPVAGYRMGPKRVAAKDATDLHVKDFIDCVRSRARPAADVEIGHRSAITAHLGNVAYRTRQKLTWDSAKEDFVGGPAATKLLGREARKPWDLI